MNSAQSQQGKEPPCFTKGSTPHTDICPNDEKWVPYFIKKLCHAVLTACICMTVGYLLLALVYCIPNYKLEPELKESAAIISAQGNHPPVVEFNDFFSYNNILYNMYLENYTDADCISISYNQKSKNPFYNALDGFQLGETQDKAHALEALSALANGSGKYVGDHSQFWHGFRIWLRPLMVRYNITEIRSITFMAATLLLVTLCVLLARVREKLLAFVPFLFAISVFNLQIESLSLLFANDFCGALLACMAVLWAYENRKERFLPEIFAVAGILVAFTSMLMLPLLTLGLPLVLWLTLARERSMRQKFSDLLCCSMCWGVGWALTVGTKCLISMQFFRTGTAQERIQLWSGVGTLSSAGRLATVGQVLDKVFGSATTRDFLLLVAVVFVVGVLLCGPRTACRIIGQMLPVFCVGVYPALWCFVLAPHTIHAWTIWNYSISLFAVLQTVWEIWQAKPVPRRQNRENEKIMPGQGGL